MLELGIGADLLRGMGWIFWGSLGFITLLVVRAQSGLWNKLASVVVLLVLFSMPLWPQFVERKRHKERYTKAKALFDERCKTAVEKIYKTVEGVEGVALLSLRTGDYQRSVVDPQWMGAGLPRDLTEQGYIESFLLWEHDSGSGSQRGYLKSTRKGAKSSGFRFADVKQSDGSFKRFRINPDPQRSASNFLTEDSAMTGPSRYAVLYEAIGDPADRELWVAGARVTALDTATGEKLAELIAYSFEPGLGSRADFRDPWAFALTCPATPPRASQATTRLFIDQVFKPKQGD